MSNLQRKFGPFGLTGTLIIFIHLIGCKINLFSIRVRSVHNIYLSLFYFFATRCKEYSVEYKRLLSFQFIFSGNIQKHEQNCTTTNSTNSYWLCHSGILLEVNCDREGEKRKIKTNWLLYFSGEMFWNVLAGRCQMTMAQGISWMPSVNQKAKARKQSSYS